MNELGRKGYVDAGEWVNAVRHDGAAGEEQRSMPRERGSG